MSMTVAALVAEANHLPMPAISYGLIALVFFAVLLGVTWTFRNNYQKNVPPSESHGHDADRGAVQRHH